jgi:hypothetical protein
MAMRSFSIKLKGKGPIDEYGARIAGINVPMQATGDTTYENKKPINRTVGAKVRIELFLKAQTNTEWEFTVQDKTANDELYKEEGYAGDTGDQSSKRDETKTLKPIE